MVKVVHKKLYYKQKGVVEGVQDQYTGVVRMLEMGDMVKFDQAHLETVLPAIGIQYISVDRYSTVQCIQWNIYRYIQYISVDRYSTVQCMQWNI